MISWRWPSGSDRRIRRQGPGGSAADRSLPRTAGVGQRLHPDAGLHEDRRAAHRGTGRRHAGAGPPPRRILDGHAQLTSVMTPSPGMRSSDGSTTCTSSTTPSTTTWTTAGHSEQWPVRTGVDPAEYAYDVQLQREGRQLIYMPLFNFAHDNLDAIHEMISSPVAMFGLSDAGAHCGQICDGSMTTTYLSLWARDRKGERRDPPRYGRPPNQSASRFSFRVARPGRRRPRLPGRLQRHRSRAPRVLPARGRRRSSCRRSSALAVSHRVPLDTEAGCGDVRGRKHTGELPGALVRGARAAPVGDRG